MIDVAWVQKKVDEIPDEKLDREIAATVSMYREVMHEEEVYLAQKANHKEILRTRLALMVERKGENWSDDLGFVRLQPSSERTTFDMDRIEQARVLLNELTSAIHKISQSLVKVDRNGTMSFTRRATPRMLNKRLAQLAQVCNGISVALDRARKTIPVKGGVRIQ
jgi:hypothetical protein